ncbi:MAG: hypothetical protein ACK4PR_03385, partial [Gammaproteobacteria bacterium]
MTWFLWIISIFSLGVLACKRTSIPVTVIGGGVLLLVVSCLGNASWILLVPAWILFAAVAVILLVDKLRILLLSKPLLAFY